MTQQKKVINQDFAAKGSTSGTVAAEISTTDYDCIGSRSTSEKSSNLSSRRFIP